MVETDEFLSDERFGNSIFKAPSAGLVEGDYISILSDKLAGLSFEESAQMGIQES